MLTLLPEHLERLSWSADRLREERTKRLRALVALAKERSSWHRQRLADFDERTLDEDDLADLPVMDKSQMMENFDRIVTDRRVTLVAANEHIAGLRNDAYFLGDLHAVASGGSSGVRGVFVWDWDGWAVVRLVALRQQLKDRLSDPELASKMPWMGQVSPSFLYATAVIDILGGLGVVLPSITRIKPGLTVLAALGCVALQGCAIVFHVSRGEAANTPFNFVLIALALFVAWGRRTKAPIQRRARDPMLPSTRW